MFLDTATLHDLDVLSTSTPRGPTLWSLVDRTRSRAGREHLRKRLTTPAHSADEILALQQAHRLIAADSTAYQSAISHIQPDIVERYLYSTWQLPFDRPGVTRFVESLWRPPWLRQYLDEVTRGQTHILALIDAAIDLRQRLSAADSAILRAVGAALSTPLDTRETQEVRRLATSPSTSARRAFDQLARGKAKPLLTALVDAIGTLEAMWSLAVTTAEHGWSYPRPGSRLSVTGLTHLFLASHVGVPNDLHLDDGTRVCFITGPNMAGKSTFLKAIAIAALLAHAGCGLPAASMEFPTTASLFSSVQIADNLSAGESFYLAEVRRIRALATSLREHGSIIAVLDEPFRGTNVHDASEATLAIITSLLAHPGALVFVASHLAEVTSALAGDPRIRLLHFAAEIANERPHFDYQLREGVSTQRLGMLLLKQENVLELLGGIRAESR